MMHYGQEQSCWLPVAPASLVGSSVLGARQVGSSASVASWCGLVTSQLQVARALTGWHDIFFSQIDPILFLVSAALFAKLSDSVNDVNAFMAVHQGWLSTSIFIGCLCFVCSAAGCHLQLPGTWAVDPGPARTALAVTQWSISGLAADKMISLKKAGIPLDAQNSYSDSRKDDPSKVSV